MADQEEVLPPSIRSLAHRLAVLIRLIKKRAKSKEQAEEWYSQLIRAVVDDLIAQGESADEAVNLALAAMDNTIDVATEVLIKQAAAKEAARVADTNQAFLNAVQTGVEYDPDASE